MQEFKAGDKVLVEAKIGSVGRDNTYYVSLKDFSGQLFYIDKVYPIPTKTYENGLAEAWEVARKIAYYDNDDPRAVSDEKLKEIFGTDDERYIFMDYTAQEVIEKIKAREDKAIHVGDVVFISQARNSRGIVTAIEDGRYTVLWSDGDCEYYSNPQVLIKTGRTADIAVLLAKIGGADEGRNQEIF